MKSTQSGYHFIFKNKAQGKLGTCGRVCLLSLLFVMLAMGCKRKYPAGILKPDALKPVLLDVMVATEVKQMDTTAVTRQHLKDSITLEIHRVLAAHKMDDSLYFRSMAFYEAHPDELKKLLDSTRSYGSKLQDSLEKKRFRATDSLAQPAIWPKLFFPAVPDPQKLPKLPVNPTVKDSAPVPVIKVKKQLQKPKSLAL